MLHPFLSIFVTLYLYTSSLFISSSFSSSLRLLSLSSGHLIMSNKPIFLKVVLLGDGGVGKSSLIQRFVSNKFDPSMFHTIGVEFLNKDMEVDGNRYTLQIWDTAGQERFKSLRTPFYRGSDCCLLTYAVDDSQSFQNLSMWKKEFLYYADVKEPENFPFIIIGNKVDIADRKVTPEEATRWCEENSKMPYYETSAKDSTNVEQAFEAAIKRISSLGHLSVSKKTDFAVDLNKKKQVGGGCCA